MASCSMIGGTRSGNGSLSSIAVTDAAFTESPKPSADYTINVGITGNNDSTLKNSTGNKVTVDAWYGYHGRSNTGAPHYMALMKSTDNGVTWSEVAGSIRFCSTVANNYYNSHMGSAPVELEDGDMLTVGYKDITGGGGITITIGGQWLMVKSRDGNNNPAMQGACGQTNHDGVWTSSTSSRYTYTWVTCPTSNSAENVGTSSGTTARLANNTGVSQNVMGFIVISGGQYNGTNVTTIYWRPNFSSAGVETITLRADSDYSPQYYTSIIMPFAGSLAAGQNIRAEGANQTSGLRGLRIWSYQQQVWSVE